MPDYNDDTGDQFETEEELSAFSRQIAISELRETDLSREQCLKQLRDWIRQNGDIENCLTGTLMFPRILKHTQIIREYDGFSVVKFIK